MTTLFQRKFCQDCGHTTYHRRPDTAPVLLCTEHQTRALEDYDLQATKMRLAVELARNSVKMFPSWQAYKERN